MSCDNLGLELHRRFKQLLGCRYSTTPIPLFYIGEDATQRPMYQGVLSVGYYEWEIELNFVDSDWQLSWSTGTFSYTVMSGNSLFGTYSEVGNPIYGTQNGAFLDTQIV